LLGPADGRYLTRAAPDAPAESVITLNTLGAPQRRLLTRRRARPVRAEPEPAPVPTARATIARAEPFADGELAARWLEQLGADRGALAAEVEHAVAILNRALRAHRAAVADPYVREVRSEAALARRVGFAEGSSVAAGRLDTFVEVVADEGRARRAERLRPQERLAATLGGRERTLVCEELVLRARLDLDSGSRREAALQARIALESLLAEIPGDASLERERGALERAREPLAVASNVALETDLDDDALAPVRAAIEGMERVLARRRTRAI
jgi:hypothetical protein